MSNSHPCPNNQSHIKPWIILFLAVNWFLFKILSAFYGFEVKWLKYCRRFELDHIENQIFNLLDALCDVPVNCKTIPKNKQTEKYIWRKWQLDLFATPMINWPFLFLFCFSQLNLQKGLQRRKFNIIGWRLHQKLNNEKCPKLTNKLY